MLLDGLKNLNDDVISAVGEFFDQSDPSTTILIGKSVDHCRDYVEKTLILQLIYLNIWDETR